MRSPAPTSAAVVLALTLWACGGGGGGRDGGPDPGADAGADGGATDGGASDGGAGDGGTAAEADIADVLGCTPPRGTFGANMPGELQLHEHDTARFPDALCNDGTAAVLHFRPYRGDANRNRWAISLRGGGGCSGADSCAARWCGCSLADRCAHTDYASAFDSNNMSGGGPISQVGGGVHTRDPSLANPFADFNHAQLVFCSSDDWAGNARGVTYTTIHPRTGAEVTYTLHFLGARILDAGLRTLRQDGAPALVYTSDGSDTPMPDLDEAEQVVIVGDSAGGAGVVNHLDRIAELLRAEHVGSVDPDIVAVIDAIAGPELARLDWSPTPAGTYAAAMASSLARPQMAGASWDETCMALHEAAGTQGECTDLSHVLRNHVTTPFFVRMALLDQLIADLYRAAGFEDPDLGPFALGGPSGDLPIVFATVLQRELAAFGALPMDAEEGDDMTVAPGVFAPACARHDTIHRDDEVFMTSIDPTGTDPQYFFDVFGAWRAGVLASSVLTTTDMMRRDTRCAPFP